MFNCICFCVCMPDIAETSCVNCVMLIAVQMTRQTIPCCRSMVFYWKFTGVGSNENASIIVIASGIMTVNIQLFIVKQLQWVSSVSWYNVNSVGLKVSQACYMCYWGHSQQLFLIKHTNVLLNDLSAISLQDLYNFFHKPAQNIALYCIEFLNYI